MRSAFVAAVLAAVAGCGPSHADVSGTVTHQGKPVVSGTVSVIGSDQMTYYGPISQDGTFTVTAVPVGPAKVGVYSPDPFFEPPIPPAQKVKLEEARRAAGIVLPPKPPKGTWFRLPSKYADPVTSGLTIDVAPRAGPVDLRLD